MANIKELLGEAYTEDVENAINSEVEARLTGGDGYVPVSKYSKVKEDLDNALAELQSSKDEASNLRTQIETLTGQISEASDLKNKVETLEKEKVDLLHENLYNEALRSYYPKNMKALSALIDKDQLTYLDDGTINGLAEQIEAIKKTDAYLFGSAKSELPPADSKALEQQDSKKAISDEIDKILKIK